MRLSHNLAALNVYRSYTKRLEEQSGALGRISSGVKIASSKDNPNVLAKSEVNKLQIRGLQMATKNLQDGVSLLQTFEGSLDNMTSILQRMRELVVKSGGTNTPEDIKIINDEISQLVDGYDDIAKKSEFNGVKLLDGSSGTLFTTSGANPGEVIEITSKNLLGSEIKANGVSLQDLKDTAKINLNNSDDRDKALQLLDIAIDSVVSTRSNFGALENRFEASFGDLNEITDRIEESNSQLVDADVAEEMLDLAKSNILVEAGNAMMVQTNKMPQDVLRILENIRGK